MKILVEVCIAHSQHLNRHAIPMRQLADRFSTFILVHASIVLVRLPRRQVLPLCMDAWRIA